MPYYTEKLSVRGFGIGSRLEGVTIRDGHGGSQQSGFFEVGGGGIFVEFNADPTVQTCIITRCDAPLGGGLFFMGGSFDTVTAINNTRIEDNEAGIGGGMYVYSANHVSDSRGRVEVRDSILINNRATDVGGGGVMVALGSRVELYDTLIDSNSHSSLSGSQVGGAGICAWKEGQGYLKRCQVINNVIDEALTGGGSGASASFFSTFVAVDTLFDGNTVVDTDVPDYGTGGGGARIDGDSEGRFINCIFSNGDVGGDIAQAA